MFGTKAQRLWDEYEGIQFQLDDLRARAAMARDNISAQVSELASQSANIMELLTRLDREPS